MKTHNGYRFLARALALLAFAVVTTAQTIPTSKLANLSVMIALGPTVPSITVGFVVVGTTAKTFLIRAIGPGLTAFGITDAGEDPYLEVFNSKGNFVGSNDDWEALDDNKYGTLAEKVNATARCGAFALKPNSFDASLLVTLPPGAYTINVRPSRIGPEYPKNFGRHLVEVYDVPAP